MPVAFLGVGVYRAWIATFFRFGAFPGMGLPDYVMFETCIGVVSLVVALLARRIAPLWENRAFLTVTGVSMTCGSLLLVGACFGPACLGLAAGALCGALKLVGLVLTGGGLALLILLWCEFFGALNPMRVAVYHAASIFVGELICWVFMGLQPAWVAVFSCVLPVVSLGWAHRSFMTLPMAERPRHGEIVSPKAVPVKPIALMAVCSFAMQFATMPGQPMIAGNVLGTLFACAFVILGSLSTSRWFNFDTIYRVAFPLICATSLLVTPLLAHHAQATAFFFDAGYTMLSMFIMIILSNMTYRFGINAAWLNGIERAARYIMESLGWVAYLFIAGSFSPEVNNVAHLAVALVVFVAFLVIVLPEKSLGARWGIDLHEEGDPQAAVGGPEQGGAGVWVAGSPVAAAAGCAFAGTRGSVGPVGPTSALGRRSSGLSGDGCASAAGSASPLAEGRQVPAVGIAPASGGCAAVPTAPVVPLRPDPFSPGRLAMRVSDLARENGLTDREEEVLQLMARKVPIAQMEENLFVARGTIKAHTGRIYKKLGVHSRSELFELLGVPEE